MKLNNKQGAIVISSSNTALAIVRSLGRQGIPVWIFDDGESPTAYSKYVKKKFSLNMQDEITLFDNLIYIAKEHGLKDWLIYPDSDKGIMFIANHYMELSQYYRLTTPPSEILKWAVDKKLTYQLAEEVGVDYPKAFYPKNREDVEAIQDCFPVILKPIHHQGHDKVSMGRAWQAKDNQELLAVYDNLINVADPSVIMIQEMIMAGVGTQFSYGALCENGEVLADIFAERKRLTPPNFGVSAFVESIELPELAVVSKKWLKKNNYTGIVELEYMLDRRDQKYKLLDVNTRSWGWIAMCAYAGVDFPYLLWRLINKEEIIPIHGQPNIRWSRTIYDVFSSLRSILSGKLSISEYLSSLIGSHHEMYVIDDLKPSMIEPFQIARRLIRKISS